MGHELNTPRRADHPFLKHDLCSGARRAPRFGGKKLGLYPRSVYFYGARERFFTWD